MERPWHHGRAIAGVFPAAASGEAEAPVPRHLICPARDPLAIGYRDVNANGTARERPGAVFAFVIAGPGVGDRLELDVDVVVAASVRRADDLGAWFEMRHADVVGPALAGLVDLEWQLARVLDENGQRDTLYAGPISIEPAAAISGVAASVGGSAGTFMIIDRRP